MEEQNCVFVETSTRFDLNGKGNEVEFMCETYFFVFQGAFNLLKKQLT